MNQIEMIWSLYSINNKRVIIDKKSTESMRRICLIIGIYKNENQ